ncbi:MAG: DnaB-like helicase C-terminal domain-containing protein [Succinivibrionaceae bacterium]
MVDIAYSFEDEYSIDVQLKFLSLLLFDEAWAELSGLEVVKPEFYENRHLHRICEWIHKYYKKYKKMPTSAVLRELAKDYINDNNLAQKDYFIYEDYINRISDLKEEDDLEYFKDKAIIFARQVMWRTALAKGGKAFELENYKDAMEAFEKVLHIGEEADMGLDFQKLDMRQFLDSLENEYSTDNMLQTHIPDWDEALGGGFIKANVHIIAAEPGGGKTKTMSYLAKEALLSYKRVVFITLELTENQIMQGIANCVTGLSISEMRNKAIQEDFIRKITKFKNDYSDNLVIKFYRPDTITCNTINNYIKTLCRKKSEELGKDWRPDVIFLDYMDKILPTTRMKGNVYEDNGNVATDCKNLAITFDCPVITGSQLGRGGWNLTGNQVISMASIAESARKVHIAHSMTTINANNAEKQLNRCRFYMAKSRTGTPGKVIYIERHMGRGTVKQVEPYDAGALQDLSGCTIRNTNNTDK